ncbi:MAG: hypothetical protein RLZZ621_1016 [Gemmatimonadota bacterium]|jgi:membrane protein DedA with SNARE-associated domain
MSSLLAWLVALPAGWLYAVIAVAALMENVFPPLPADTVIALGAFVAARGNGTMIGVWIATMVGNIGGAMLMYAIGKRYGLPWLARRLPGIGSSEAAESLAARYATQGITAIVVSRFLPAVRAVVPPVAGAMGIGAWRAGSAMFVASGIWYAIVAVLAFRAGANAEVLMARIAAQQRVIGLGAVVLAVVLALSWWTRARRARGPRD